VCSISTNATMDEQLTDLERSHDRDMVERRLFQFASEANVENSGGLDDPTLVMKRMPEELRDVRKIRIGRHRVYFTGSHRQCSYRAFYIKAFKKTGVSDEDDPKHQRKLGAALREPATRALETPPKPDESSNQ
jgi:hypothetical protein